MTMAERFISRLVALKDGERAKLRQLAGETLDKELAGFELFTGLWWPVRKQSPRTPDKSSSWLIAKLYGSFPVPHVRAGPSIAQILGLVEPQESFERKRFRGRFDALLEAKHSQLEMHLSWALREARKLLGRGRITGMDWVEMLDDIRWWDRSRGAKQDVRSKWLFEFLQTSEKRS